MNKQTAIVIGAGIVGLATARALAKRGYAVTVIERTQKAVGASVRNFGMVWPIGQPAGTLYNRAMRSREIWLEVARAGDIWADPVGSLHLAYNTDEWKVLEELHQIFCKEGRSVALLQPGEVLERSPAALKQGLLGGLFSADEVIVDPRQAIAALPGYLTREYGVTFHWGKCVSYIADQTAYIGNEEEHEADLIVVCSGADFETLYPEYFASLPITKCKLQMMRMGAQPDEWRMGPALCGGLSLIHYNSFKAAPSLAELKKRYELQMPDYLEWGIHVMVSQNGMGELTIGDSHEYGLTHEPFDRAVINNMILFYLEKMAAFQDPRLIETWNGIYPKLTDGQTEVFFSPEQGVHILNGLGGAGMTLSFGLAEELVATL